MQESGGFSVTVAGSVAGFELELHPDIPVDSLPAAPEWVGDGTNVHSPFPTTVVQHRELHTPESDRSCLHVELDFSGSEVMCMHLHPSEMPECCFGPFLSYESLVL